MAAAGQGAGQGLRIAIIDACPSGEITRSKGGKVVSPCMEDRPVDVEGLVLGRAASEVAKVLRGKTKPDFTPFVDTGDYVIVVNAD